jgi:hypothetical protein
MDTQLSYETVGEESKVSNATSSYQPDADVRDRTKRVKDDYYVGVQNLQEPIEELNGMSLLSADAEYTRNWLSWSPPPTADEDDEWRWTGVRPMTRNKIVSTAAHLTQNLLAPAVFAQNDEDEDDETWGEVGQLLLEYNIRRSDYSESFLYGVIAGLVHPLNYFTVEYVDAKQTVWAGGKEPKVVRDDEASGFQYGLAPMDEMLFENLWQFKWQLQDFRIRRKRISYELAKSIYGEHENFQYVQPGLQTVMGDDGVFYDVEDYHGNMVELVVWMHRRSDCEIPLVNGIYLGNPNTEYNPFTHRTNKNKPKYPECKYGAEPIDEMRFIGYKSLAAKLMNDQQLADEQWQIAIDASRLQAFLPTIITGTGKIDYSVVAPAAVTTIEKDAKVTPLSSSYNADAAFRSLYEAERSANESSPDPQLAGKSTSGDLPSTARQSLLIQENAERNLGLMGKMILGTMLPEIGGLMLDDIIRYQTTGEVDQILAGVPRMKYRTFILDGKEKDGMKKNHIVRLSDEFAGTALSEEDMEMENVKRLDEAGEGKEIYDVNPAKFAELDFLVTYDYQELMRRNTAFERSFMLAGYDKAISDPNIAKDPEASLAVTRDFLLKPLAGAKASKYMPKKQMVESMLPQNPTPEELAAGGGASGGGQDVPNRFVRSAAMESVRGSM